MAKRFSVRKSAPGGALFLTLKRFAMDWDAMDRVKDERPVDVPARLALGGADYGLCGALLHVGTTHAGHYEAEVKDLDTGAWWTFNDDACGAVDADGSRRADGTSAY